MRVSFDWLNNLVDHGWGVAELADALTMAGLEVTGIEDNERHDSRVIVGEIVATERHDHSNSLTLCKVRVSEDDVIQIVCGAPNINVTDKVAVALPGATLANDRRIAPCLIHGVESEGMILSEGELISGEARDVILSFDGDAAVGMPINDYLNLDDHILEFDLTPNRADCLGVLGIAREVSVLSNAPLRIDSLYPEIPASTNTTLDVQVIAPQACPRYVGRLIRGIRTDAVTPDWMKQKLMRSGLRCIHPIVDITNYVMLELGQPMHAFDTDLFDSGGIIVRLAETGEKLTLLDGREIDLIEKSLLITDRTQPIGLAGIMGGESCAVHPGSTNIFLEAAFFSPNAIRYSASRYNQHTDASHRFERGVDPNLQEPAIQRATQLILEIVGGTAGPVQNIHFNEHLPVKKYCEVRQSRVKRVLGVELKADTIEDILTRVNMDCLSNGQSWKVLPPSYRFDLEEEHDQIEEIARIHGYNAIPTSLNLGSALTTPSVTDINEANIRETLHHAGYQEVITYSFVDPNLQELIKPSVSGKKLSNPIASNLSVMRTALVPGMVKAFLHNHRRQQRQIRFYEIGSIFEPDGEHLVLGGLSYGDYATETWSNPDRVIDFFDVKGHVLELLELKADISHFEFVPEQYESLHPGCSAGIYFDGELLGTIGQLHPRILAELEIIEEIFVFQLSLQRLTKKSINQYETISRYPAVTRDVALLVNQDVVAADVEKIIRSAAGDALEHLKLFDIYAGSGIEKNKKSVAYRLIFRLKSRTLTDAEVNSSVAGILEELNSHLGAQIRT